MDRLTVLADAATLARAAAERITSLIEAATVTRGAAALALSGGHTPEPVYELLANRAQPWHGRIDWTRVHLYWSDERNVPPDHPDSNCGMATRALVRHVPIPASQVHRMRGELPADDAGREYDALLRSRRGAVSGPLFDVMLLGIGPDAHVASIFPDSPLLRREAEEAASRPLATGVWVPKMNQSRITLTPPALLDSTAVVVLAAGSDKADAIAAALEGDLDVGHHPAQMLRDAGARVDWVMDEAAAARLRGARRA